MAIRERLGAGTVAALTLAVAAVSVATGVVSIASGRAPVGGSLVGVVPEVVRQTAAFTGTLTGFAALAAGVTLRKRLRIGRYLAALILPLTAVQGVLGGDAAWYAAPLIGLSALALLALAINWRRFDRDADLTATQIAATVALVGAQAYGVVGTYALRDGFVGVDSPVDAFYFTVVTGSTVGYGDITAQSQVARLFAVSALLINVAAFAVALGVLLTPAIEARLSRALGRMTETQLDVLNDHVLVLGYGELSEPIIEELRGQTPFVVVTTDETRVRRLRDRDVDAVTGDPSDEATLTRVGVDRARAVVAATNDDAEDALSILTARQLNPETRIVAAATQRENVAKLRRAGADAVVSPATIGGHLIVESALGDDDTEAVADRLLGQVTSDEDGADVEAAVSTGSDGVSDPDDTGETDNRAETDRTGDTDGQGPGA